MIQFFQLNEEMDLFDASIGNDVKNQQTDEITP